MIDKFQDVVIDRIVEPFAHKVERGTEWDNFNQAKCIVWLRVIFETIRLATLHDPATIFRATSIASAVTFLLFTVPSLESHCRSGVRAGLKNSIRHCLPYKLIFRLYMLAVLPMGICCLGRFVWNPSWNDAYFIFSNIGCSLAVCLFGCTPLPPRPKRLPVPKLQPA